MGTKTGQGRAQPSQQRAAKDGEEEKPQQIFALRKAGKLGRFAAQEMSGKEDLEHVKRVEEKIGGPGLMRQPAAEDEAGEPRAKICAAAPAWRQQQVSHQNAVGHP